MNKYKSVGEKVKDIIEHAENDQLKVVDRGRTLTPAFYNQRETIRRIYANLNDKYLNRTDDAIYWNLPNSRVVHFSKNIALDTKDFLPYADGSLNMFQSWALRRQARRWFKDNSFYQVLNDLADGVSAFGSCVWKKTKDEDGITELEECDLENLYFDQTAKCIRDTEIVEKHILTESELYEKKDIWDNFDELVEKLENGKVEIWEYTGFWMDGDKPKLIHQFGYGYGDKEITLFTEDIKEEDIKYYDFHLGKYMGRWLRVGVVERLFKLQARINELVNQNAKTTAIASLLLLQSANPDASGNVLEQAIDGQIIPDETLRQVGITNTGLSQFLQEMNLIEQQANILCLTPDIIQGEQSPSGTPFRSLAVVNSAAKSAFTAYRQNLGEKVAQILVDDIFPELVKKWNKGVVIEIAEDDEDVEMYDKTMLAYLKKEYLLNYGPVTPEVEQMLQLKVSEELNSIGRRIEIKKDFFNFKYGIKMMPTDESIDKAAMNDAMFNALQMVQANPGIVEVPIFKQYLENNGISWWKMTAKQVQALQQGQTNKLPEQKKPDELLAQASVQ